jgi:hypothetical protein
MIKQKKYSLRRYVKIILYTLFISGWLLPKIVFDSFNIGIQEFSGVLILCSFRSKFYIHRFWIIEVFFSVFVLFISIIQFLYLRDLYGIFISFRVLLFVLVASILINDQIENLFSALKINSFIILVFIVVNVFRILLNIFENSFDPISFFHGSDSYRVRAPFENGLASSQIPIGYLFSILFCFPFFQSSFFKKYTLLIGAIGTTSRAAMISLALKLAVSINLKKISSLIIIIFLSALMFLVYAKSFTGDSGEVSGSTSKRAELYINAFQLMTQDPQKLLVGFGLSPTALEKYTGESFYESFVINSFMQGGILLMLASLAIFIKTAYFDYKIGLNWIIFPVLIGNLIGGSNYFSMYAFPFYALLISYQIKLNSNIK